MAGGRNGAMSRNHPITPQRERTHVERMLKRARHRQKQAAKLVEKWEGKLAELDRAGVEAKQPRLWEEELSGDSEALYETDRFVCVSSTDVP